MNLEFSALDITERIQSRAGSNPGANTVDRFQAGDPNTLVHRIAVTMMPTLNVLYRAVEAGCNFVISHEPAFYGHRDDQAQLEREDDEVWKAKRDFIERNELVLWRFHDIPHLQQPDAILKGMIEELGWSKFQSAFDERLFTLPPATLAELARELQVRLDAQTLRVVGDGAMTVNRVALSPGCPGFEAHRRLLQRPEVEVLVMGEAFEWETIAYAADASSAGQGKALIVVGHIPSEQGGMKRCARWFQTLLLVPVVWIPTKEPFWSPSA